MMIGTGKMKVVFPVTVITRLGEKSNESNKIKDG
jgi:hypothetical protein